MHVDRLDLIKENSIFKKLEANADPFKNKHPNGYEHGFMVKTKEREYILYSKDYNLKELFVYTLKQIMVEKQQFLESNMNKFDINLLYRVDSIGTP